MTENKDNIQQPKKVVIELDNVKRDFLVGDETVHALKGVSFKIYEGEFVTIMGKSGSGKSTLLNQLGCLDTPSSGEYYLDGVSVRTMSRSERAILRNRKIGFIFQNYNLLPKTTSVENVELPLMYNPHVTAEERKQRAIEALQAVDWVSDSITKAIRCRADKCNVWPSHAPWSTILLSSWPMKLQEISIRAPVLKSLCFSRSSMRRDAPSSLSPIILTLPTIRVATSNCAMDISLVTNTTRTSSLQQKDLLPFLPIRMSN